MIDRLEESAFVQSCGRIGRFFSIDPIAVADSPDMFTYAFRAAAYNYASRKEREEEERRAAEVKAQASR